MRIARLPHPHLLTALILCILVASICVPTVVGWSNGGYSADPSNPDYGTHDWIAEHALDWLPENEKAYIVNNLATYLYGTELPDNWQASDGIGDTTKHHIYFSANGTLTDDASAVRAYESYNLTLSYLNANDYVNASKHAGIMAHYIVDVAVFGHVMGASTEWGAEQHHSDYESYVNTRTNAYTDTFNTYLVYDGTLDTLTAYDAAINLAYDTTFDVDGDLTCLWMDQNYNWDNMSFIDRCGESLNLAANYLADVLHTLYNAHASSASLSCVLSESSITYGSSITISGTLLDTLTQEGLAGRPILLEQSSDGSTWNQIANILTAPGGDYTHVWLPAAGAFHIRATWIGDTMYADATSSIHELYVAKASSGITCWLSATTVTVGEELTVSGSMTPPRSGETVTLAYTKPDHSIITRTVTTGTDGSYSDSYAPDAVGSWSIRASWEGNSSYVAASSVATSFTVKKKSMCIIATTTYGSELSSEVQFLRNFRDYTVMATFAGNSFMTVFNQFYYSFSPKVAATISSNDNVRRVVKVMLYPLMGILHLSSAVFSLFHFNPELGVVMAGLVASTLIALVYLVPWTVLVSVLKKYTPSKKLIRWVGLICGGSMVGLTLAEVTKAFLLMMVSTGLFVLCTMSLSTLVSIRILMKRLYP
ncbi:MAG: hypothetical protein JSV20_06645 [Candidatus Bathyarchaeota archaeon]|nr:MAG: hypothetical protein JSV20_06645 [Candidatus Bathyarchaeota archaeon]